MGGNHENVQAVPGWAATVNEYSRALGFGVSNQNGGRKSKKGSRKAGRKSKKSSRKAGRKSRRRIKKKMFGMNIF